MRTRGQTNSYENIQEETPDDREASTPRDQRDMIINRVTELVKK